MWSSVGDYSFGRLDGYCQVHTDLKVLAQLGFFRVSAATTGEGAAA
jgi:hypothetical protein